MRHVFRIDEDEHPAWLARNGDGFALDVAGVRTTVAIEALAGGRARLRVGEATREITIAADGDCVWIHLEGEIHEVSWLDPVTRLAEAAAHGLGDIAKAPMPGSVVAVSVGVGDTVAAGAALVVIESMKLEIAVNAQRAGVVAEIHVAVGQTFERDAVLVTLAPAAEG